MNQRMRFPDNNVVFVAHSLSVALILQLTQVYKINLRQNVFVVTSQQRGDIPYLTVLQKHVQEAQNQVHLICQDIVNQLIILTKEASTIIVSGPIWLINIAQRLGSQ